MYRWSFEKIKKDTGSFRFCQSVDIVKFISKIEELGDEQVDKWLTLVEFGNLIKRYELC